MVYNLMMDSVIKAPKRRIMAPSVGNQIWWRSQRYVRCGDGLRHEVTYDRRNPRTALYVDMSDTRNNNAAIGPSPNDNIDPYLNHNSAPS